MKTVIASQNKENGGLQRRLASKERGKNGSDTESGEESEEEQEKMSCMEFSALMQNIGLMDRELAIAWAEKLFRQRKLCLCDQNFKFR